MGKEDPIEEVPSKQSFTKHSVSCVVLVEQIKRRSSARAIGPNNAFLMEAIYHNTHGSRSVSDSDWEDLITARDYRAVVFDCDGTLVESSRAHFNSFRDAARAQGEILDKAWYEQRTGLDRSSLLKEFAASAGQSFDIDLAILQSVKAFEHHLHLVHAVPETSRLLLRLSSRLSIAVGTNAELEVAELSLAKAGLINAVRFIVSISDGLPPKPSPDIFLTAAQKMGCSAEVTLVIEDSKQGVEAARAAGMDVFQVSI